MVKQFNFIIEDDCKEALKEVVQLKAFKVRNDDNENNFADVYFHVQHEADMYEEGEENDLTLSTYLSVKKWLKKHHALYMKYECR